MKNMYLKVLKVDDAIAKKVEDFILDEIKPYSVVSIEVEEETSLPKHGLKNISKIEIIEEIISFWTDETLNHKSTCPCNPDAEYHTTNTDCTCSALHWDGVAEYLLRDIEEALRK